MFFTHASPWIAGSLALWYLFAIIVAELLRHYEPTGKVFRPLRERKQIILRKPRRTYVDTITWGMFTWTVWVMHYRPTAGVIGLTVAALLIYVFVALWCGPMLRIVLTLEGVMLMAAAVNCALYLSVHTWNTLWLTIQIDTFISVAFIVGLVGLLQLIVVYGNRRIASRRPPPPSHSPH